MEGHVAALDVHGAAAALGHLEAVAQQGEARHIGAAVDPVFHHDIPGGPVQGGHLAIDPVHHRRLRQPRLGGGGQHAHAQGLGQQQDVPGLCAAVGQHPPGVHEAGHGQAVNRLRAVDGVSPGDDGPGLIGLVVSAPQQLLDHLPGHGLRQAQDVQGQLLELYKIFMENDASLVEVNPLALTKKGTLMAIDAKIVFDDNALYRHPEVHALFDPTEEERIEADAKDKGFS